MDKKELKKLVTSLGLAGLMAGVTVTMSAGPAIGGSG
jgi:radical SAM modification target selenobiotic family peptide